MGLCGCGQGNGPPATPPPDVSVTRVEPTSVTVFDEYAAQAQAADTVEIRARVGGILVRQAFADGAKVKKGDLLFVIDQQSYIAALAQAEAALAQAQASLLNSRRTLARTRTLRAEGVVSQQNLDAAVAKERTDAAAVQGAEAQVKQARLNLGYTAIRAPRDGIMSKALIERGGLVNVATTLLTVLYSVDPMYVSFAVSERKLPELRKQLQQNPAAGTGDERPFRLRLVDGSEYKYRGKLNFVDPAIDPREGTLQVRISVPNPDGWLRSGEFVRVIMPAHEDPNAILVPQQAVQELQDKRSVFVVGPQNKITHRDIVTRTRIGNDWLVERGLKPGELVVVEGISKVEPGVTVRPVFARQEQPNGSARGAGVPGGEAGETQDR